MNENRNIRIIVLGRNYTSILGMVRAIGNYGYNSTILKLVKNKPSNSIFSVFLKKIIGYKDIEASSKYVDCYDYVNEKDESAIFIKLKSFESSNEKIILIPTDDISASVIDKNIKNLGKKYICPNIKCKPNAVIDFMDKNKQKKLVSKFGIKTVDTWVIKIHNKKYSIPTNIKYPVFTKPNLSFMGQKEFMKKCNNKEELIKLLDEISNISNCSILLEEFIEIEKEYGVLGCSYNGIVTIPGIIEKINCGSGSHKGVTLSAKTMPINNYCELYKKLCSFIESLQFNGLFDIELYSYKGNFYFNELNMRFGAEGYGMTGAGSNLPALYLSYILKKNFCIKTIDNESTFISDKVNLDEFENGYINYKEYKNNFKNKDFRFIKNNEDKKPYKNFKKREKLIIIKRILKK